MTAPDQPTARCPACTSPLVPVVGVAAAALRIGDRFVWGGTRTLQILDLVDGGELFLSAHCVDLADNQPVAFDLHRREEIVVISPRPASPEGSTR
jgi:hypothetical protein